MSIRSFLKRVRRGRDAGVGPVREPDRGHFARGRGLDGFEKSVGADTVLAAVEAGRTRSSPCRVLEIGCGEGRVLLELRKWFPDVDLVGVNKEPWAAMRGAESLPDVARYYGSFDESELARIVLPEIRFCDAKKLPFDDASFDVVISQVAFPHVRRKDLAIAEAWRVLRPSGVALIEVDARAPQAPDFMRRTTPRFGVRGREALGLDDVVLAARERGFDVELLERGDDVRRVSIRMTRNVAELLRFGLRFDRASSFGIHRIRRAELHTPGRSSFWGFRSVFYPSDDDPLELGSRTRRNTERRPQ